jgi:hypothetical protein
MFSAGLSGLFKRDQLLAPERPESRDQKRALHDLLNIDINRLRNFFRARRHDDHLPCFHQDRLTELAG